MQPEPSSSDSQPASRREFLRTAAISAAGATCLPAITILSGCASSAAKPAAKIVDFELEVKSLKASPDGRRREVLCYNDRIPGPEIRLEEGQTLRVRVENKLAVPTSVHWHGMHQPGTWKMDGVADVSAPPIPPGDAFIYRFEATPAGTHWYHSHTGVQYGDGLFGPLIVDEKTPPAKYDRDAILVINDWFLKPSEEILAGLVGNPGEGETPADGTGKKMEMKPGDKEMPGKKMADGKMAGMGDKPDVGDVPFESFLFNGQGRLGDAGSPAVYALGVQPDEVIRVRIINASSTYAFRFQIDGHRLTVFATDGSPMVPVEVDNLVVNVGERYDVLLTAKGSGNHWIRAATLAGGEGWAILRYSGASEDPQLGPVEWGQDQLTPEAMRSPEPVKLADKPREIRWTLGGSMMPYRWNINGEEYPDAEPVKLTTGEEVRFIIENPTGMDHPFHLHGHYFHVLGPPDKMNLKDPVRKDTVNIPSKGALALQWQATNPGKWFFHCHIEWHVATGMARVIEIG